MRARSSEDTLRELKSRGARRLKKVNFRANRSTIWSLTQDATVLNLHVAYRRAPASILDAFATIVRGRGWRTAQCGKPRSAYRTGRVSPRARSRAHVACAAHASRRPAMRKRTTRSRIAAATKEQRAYLRALFRYLNKTRFDGLLAQ